MAQVAKFPEWAAWLNRQLGRHGWNGKQFQERADVSHAAVSRWRRGIDRPRASMARQIAEALGVTTDEVLEVIGFRGCHRSCLALSCPCNCSVGAYRLSRHGWSVSRL
jgi:hypothetical protein